MKLKRSQNGFGLGEVIVLVVVVGALGAGGTYVVKKNISSTADSAKSQQKTDTGSTAETEGEATKDESSQKSAITDPATYTNTTAGVAFMYPKAWGELKDNTDVTFGYLAMTDDLSAKGGSKVMIGEAGLDGRFGIDVAPENEFTVSTAKYGATVKPYKSGSAYAWRVSEVNPADTKDKINDSYPVTSFKNPGGVMVYDFGWSDEGSYHAVWVVKTSAGFVTVGLPGIHRYITDTNGDSAASATERAT